MKKGLLIAEKPSLMRDIRSGYLKAQKELNYNLDFTALRGHFMELKYPEEYKEEWKDWKIETLPIIPENFQFKVKKSTQSDYNKIKKMLDNGNYDFVINACDAGREGQAIFWSFYNHTNCKLPVKRIWINDTTEPVIIKGLKNLLDETNEDLINIKDASFYRMYLDWLIGMNLSRAISLKTNATIAIGRVMTPTLKIVVDRDLEIKNFTPKTTYEVDANFDNKYIGTWFNKDTNENRFEDKDKAEKFINNLGKTGTVVEVETKRETRRAPANYSLGDLQRDANETYGFTAKQTLGLAQELYETHKILSYPRTESKALSTSLGKELPDYLQAIKEIPEVEKEVDLILTEPERIDKVVKSKRYVDNSKLTDHHAIIPTKKKPNLNALSEDEKKLYLMVVKRFVSTFLDPYLQDKTTIITEVDQEHFKTTGSVLVDLGYRKLYNYKKNDDEIPKVNKGDIFTVTEFNLQEKISTPPAYYNDSTLIGAMQNAGRFIDEEDEELVNVLKDSEGIGTVATRDSIIEKLIEKDMLIRKGKSIRATDFGINIIKTIGDRKISSPELTAEWENKLVKIEEGEQNKEEFLLLMKNYVEDQVKDIISNVNTNLGKNTEFEVIGKCPACNQDVIMTKKFYLCTNYKGKDNGCSFIIGQKINNGTVNKKNALKIINGEKTDFINFKTKDGKPYKAQLIFNKENNKLEFAKGDKIGICPKCNNDIIDKGTFYGCEGFKSNGCKFGLPKKIMGASITNKDAEDLLNGKIIGPKTFTWKSGKKGQAKLQYSKDNNKLQFIFKEAEVIGKCPICSNDVEDRGSYIKCTNSSCDFSISKNIMSAKLSDKDIQDLLNNKETRSMTFTWKSGKKGDAKLKYNPNNKKLEFIFNNTIEPIGKCPYCDTGEILDYKSFIKCNNSDCNFSLSRKISGANLNDNDIKKLLKGEESSLKTFTWKNGSTDKKKIRLNNEKKIDFI